MNVFCSFCSFPTNSTVTIGSVVEVVLVDDIVGSSFKSDKGVVIDVVVGGVTFGVVVADTVVVVTAVEDEAIVVVTVAADSVVETVVVVVAVVTSVAVGTPVAPATVVDTGGRFIKNLRSSSSFDFRSPLRRIVVLS